MKYTNIGWARQEKSINGNHSKIQRWKWFNNSKTTYYCNHGNSTLKDNKNANWADKFLTDGGNYIV